MRAEIDNAMHRAQQPPRTASAPDGDPIPSLQPGENQSVHLPIENPRNPFPISKISQINRYKIRRTGSALRPSNKTGEPAVDGYTCRTKIGVSRTPSTKLPKLMDTLFAGLGFTLSRLIEVTRSKFENPTAGASPTTRLRGWTGRRGRWRRGFEGSRRWCSFRRRPGGNGRSGRPDPSMRLRVCQPMRARSLARISASSGAEAEPFFLARRWRQSRLFT